MGTHRERFLHPIATPTTVLGRVASRNRYHGHVGNLPIIPDPPKEQPPTGIADTLCQMVILDQAGDLQVFKSYQVARPAPAHLQPWLQSLYAAFES